MNAIILVAGMGTRLYPITKNTHKSLITINNEPFLERQIKFLIDAGITDITLVTGYLSKSFKFLKDKYKVNIIFNDKYKVYNNAYSLYLARHLLDETYILEGDIYYNKNIFKLDFKKSIYIASKKSRFNNEWVFYTDKNNKITKIAIESGINRFILCGGGYVNKNNSLFIKNKLEEIYKTQKHLLKTYFWDDIPLNYINEMDDIYLYSLEENDVYEVDTLYEYYTLKNLIEKPKR